MGLIMLPIFVLAACFVLYYFTGSEKKADKFIPNLMSQAFRSFNYVWLYIISLFAFFGLTLILSFVFGEIFLFLVMYFREFVVFVFFVFAIFVKL